MNTVIDYKMIGNRLKNRRKELKLTQEEVCAKANITTFYLSKLENGKSTPTLETLAVLAKVLQTDLVYLLSGSSKLNDLYIDERLAEISAKANEEQLELIIKIANTILEG
ncbi:MAG: helix-turn-helix domain-containing protein [Floccifex sp.]